MTGATMTMKINQWICLAASLIVAGIVALSVHVGSLALGAAFPVAKAPLWAQWLTEASIAGAVLVCLKLAQQRSDVRSFLVRTTATFIILMLIQETLRVAIMNVVVTGGWAYSALGLVKPLIRVLMLAFLCVLVQPKVQSGRMILMAALIVGALSTASRKLVAYLLEPVMQHFASLAQPDLYVFPYPFHVTLAAYLTFAEPVIGALLLIMLIDVQGRRAGVFSLLIAGILVAGIKGVAGNTLFYSAFTGPSALIGVISWGQFLLEFITLGALVALAWRMFGGYRRGAPKRKLETVSPPPKSV